MATVTIRPSDRFPVGITVSVYPRRAFIPGQAPSGQSVTSATVATDSTITFAGLDTDADYVAFAQVNSIPVYVGFTTDSSVTATSFAAASDLSDEIGNRQTAVAAEAAARAAADAQLAATGLALPTNTPDQSSVLYDAGIHGLVQKRLSAYGSDNVLYVSQNGNDANDGLTIGQAKRTINAALAGLPAGSGLFILPGTYTEDITISQDRMRILTLGGRHDFQINTTTVHGVVLRPVTETSAVLHFLNADDSTIDPIAFGHNPAHTAWRGLWVWFEGASHNRLIAPAFRNDGSRSSPAGGILGGTGILGSGGEMNVLDGGSFGSVHLGVHAGVEAQNLHIIGGTKVDSSMLDLLIDNDSGPVLDNYATDSSGSYVPFPGSTNRFAVSGGQYARQSDGASHLYRFHKRLLSQANGVPGSDGRGSRKIVRGSGGKTGIILRAKYINVSPASTQNPANGGTLTFPANALAAAPASGFAGWLQNVELMTYTGNTGTAITVQRGAGGSGNKGSMNSSQNICIPTGEWLAGVWDDDLDQLQVVKREKAGDWASSGNYVETVLASTSWANAGGLSSFYLDFEAYRDELRVKAFAADPSNLGSPYRLYGTILAEARYLMKLHRPVPNKIVNSGTGGTLAADVYRYVATAVEAGGRETLPSRSPGAQDINGNVSVPTQGSFDAQIVTTTTGKLTPSWTAPPGYDHLRVYRKVGAGAWQYVDTPAGADGVAAAVALVDDGSLSWTTADPPVTDAGNTNAAAWGLGISGFVGVYAAATGGEAIDDLHLRQYGGAAGGIVARSTWKHGGALTSKRRDGTTLTDDNRPFYPWEHNVFVGPKPDEVGAQGGFTAHDTDFSEGGGNHYCYINPARKSLVGTIWGADIEIAGYHNTIDVARVQAARMTVSGDGNWLLNTHFFNTSTYFDLGTRTRLVNPILDDGYVFATSLPRNDLTVPSGLTFVGQPFKPGDTLHGVHDLALPRMKRKWYASPLRESCTEMTGSSGARVQSGQDGYMVIFRPGGHAWWDGVRVIYEALSTSGTASLAALNWAVYGLDHEDRFVPLYGPLGPAATAPITIGATGLGECVITVPAFRTWSPYIGVFLSGNGSCNSTTKLRGFQSTAMTPDTFGSDDHVFTPAVARNYGTVSGSIGRPSLAQINAVTPPTETIATMPQVWLRRAS